MYLLDLASRTLIMILRPSLHYNIIMADALTAHPNLRPLHICFLTFLTFWTLFHSETCSSHLDGVLFIPSLGCIFYMPGIAASTPFFCAPKTYILGFCTTIQHSGRLLVIPFAFAGSFWIGNGIDWGFCFIFCWNLGGFVHFIQFLGVFWMGYLGGDVLTLRSPLRVSRGLPHPVPVYFSLLCLKVLFGVGSVLTTSCYLS